MRRPLLLLALTRRRPSGGLASLGSAAESGWACGGSHNLHRPVARGDQERRSETRTQKDSMASMMASNRTEWNRSKLCWAPGSSA